MNRITEQLNEDIKNGNPYIFEMLSNIGKKLFFPKGILSQSAEAKVKANKLNATIGIATEDDEIMYFPSVMNSINSIPAQSSLTYAPSFGIPDLRKIWKDFMYKKNPSLSGNEISLPIVTNGITHAISMTGDIWVELSDIIILPDMFWGNYSMIMNIRKGASLIHFSMFNNDGNFNINGFEEIVKKEAAQRDKVIVLLNFPNNPTGYTVSKNEGQMIADILINVAENGTNVITICDDAYFGLFYEEETLKESMFTLLCGRHERLLPIKLDGATKENFVWGLRVGFITYGCKISGDSLKFYEALEKKTAGCIRGDISNGSHLSQSIVLKSMQGNEFQNEVNEKFEILRDRAKRVKEVLNDPKFDDEWDVYPFNSGYFMCLKLKTVNSEKLRVHLLDKYGVGLIALGERDLRVAFSCLDINDIAEFFDIILQGVEDLSTDTD